MEQGSDAMPAGVITDYEEKYFSILKQGCSKYKAISHKYAKQDEAALLKRMEKYNYNYFFVPALLFRTV